MKLRQYQVKEGCPKNSRDRDIFKHAKLTSLDKAKDNDVRYETPKSTSIDCLALFAVGLDLIRRHLIYAHAQVSKADTTEKTLLSSHINDTAEIIDVQIIYHPVT